MDEPTQPAEAAVEAKRSRGFAGYLVWGFGIVIFYLVSTGPIGLLQAKGIIGQSTGRALIPIYTPWKWAYLHTPLHKPLGMYTHLWRPDQFESNGNLNDNISGVK